MPTPSQPRSWWTRLNSFWQANQENEAKQGLIARLTDRYDQYQEQANAQAVTQLGVGGLPWSNPPAQQPEVTWQRPTVTTRQAPKVPSPSLDEYNTYCKWGQSPDLMVRRKLYDEFEKIFNTCSIVMDAADDLIDGGLGGDGLIVAIKPEIGLENDAQSEDEAGTCQEFWSRTMKLAPVHWQCMVARALIRFGVAPVELVANDYGIIEELNDFSPLAFQINNGPGLKFYKGQRDCYALFDDAGKNLLALFPESLVVALMTKDLGWHRYGMGKLYAALSCARALVRSEAMLADNREAGQIQKWERYSDVVNNPAPISVIEDAKKLTDEALKASGQQLSPFRTRIYNGPTEVGMHTVPTGFYNDIGDIRWHAGGVAKRFGSQLARLIAPETLNRATADRFDAMAYVAQAAFAKQFGEMLFPEIFKRQLAWYNGLAQQQSKLYRLGPASSPTIGAHRVRVDIQVNQKELPEILLDKAESAVVAYEKDLYDWESAVESQALAQGKDPRVVIERLKAEGKDPASKAAARAKQSQSTQQTPQPDQQQIGTNSYPGREMRRLRAVR